MKMTKESEVRALFVCTNYLILRYVNSFFNCPNICLYKLKL